MINSCANCKHLNKGKFKKEYNFKSYACEIHGYTPGAVRIDLNLKDEDKFLRSFGCCGGFEQKEIIEQMDLFDFLDK